MTTHRLHYRVCSTVGVPPPQASTAVTMQANPSYIAVEEGVALEPNPCYSTVQANSVYEPISGHGEDQSIGYIVCVCHCTHCIMSV